MNAAHIKYETSERDRKCRICNDIMARGTWAIVMHDIHVSPKTVSLHFHQGCLLRALESANLQRCEATP